MKRPPDLHELRAFDLVARHGGFGRAAKAAGLSKATLSRQVRSLEQRLGLRLFDHDGRSFALTTEGVRLHGRTHGLLLELEEAVGSVADERGPPRGRLRVSCPMTYGHFVMGRLASGFAQAFPAVELDVMVEDREVDLVAEGVDVAIRVDPRPDSRLVGRCIMRNDLHLLASAGMACPGDDGDAVPAITRLGRWHERPVRLVEGAATQRVRLKPVLGVTSLWMQRDAMLAGRFAAVLPLALLAEDVRRGDLVDWGRVDGPPVEVWALHVSRRLVSPKIQSFLDFLPRP